MNLLRNPGLAAALAAVLLAAPARADESFRKVCEDVNKKMVKIFGSGGIRGLAAYGSGVLVSPDGYILTVSSHMLDTQDLRVHLYDGQKFSAKVVAVEPELDVALVKIDKVEDLPFFDVPAAAQRGLAEPGTGVLAFSNMYEIATRDEPMSVQRGVISSLSKLQGKSGIFDAPYSGQVYVIDTVTNNPGAAGGAVTTRKGELLGLIGKEVRNSLTDTMINYSLPLQAKVEVEEAEGKKRTVSLVEMIEQKDKYVASKKERIKGSGGGYHGIVLIYNAVDRTPPFVDDLAQGSPAEKAGLKPDDLIVYLDGEQVVSIKQFRELIDRYKPGEEVKVEVRRGDKLTTLTLKMDKPPTAKKP